MLVRLIINRIALSSREIIDLIVSVTLTFFAIKGKGKTVQPGELGPTHPQTNKEMDGRYQVHYLPASRSRRIVCLSVIMQCLQLFIDCLA